MTPSKRWFADAVTLDSNTMTHIPDASQYADDLDRIEKLIAESGRVRSFAEAQVLLRSLHLVILIGPDVKDSRTLQAAALTTVATATRAFKGGVRIAGDLDVRFVLHLPIPGSLFQPETLREALVALGAKSVHNLSPGSPTIVIGDVQLSDSPNAPVLRVSYDGWTAVALPAHMDRFPERGECEPAGVLAGALAVSELFQHGVSSGLGGYRPVGFSLWEPAMSWEKAEPGPAVTYLPAEAWLVGLGHLGQAYLWTLGLLPYRCPDDVIIFLQDTDELKRANLSTSVLTVLDTLGEMKTRAMSAWAKERGFQTRIVERIFDSHFRRRSDEPGLALFGVDNYTARADIEAAGFDIVVEAGLGARADRYLNFQVHTFPGPTASGERWGRPESHAHQNLDATPYKDLAARGVDVCGLVEIAGRAVGAPFVGVATSAFVVAQVLRILHGAVPDAVVSGTLRAPDYMRAIPNAMLDRALPLSFTTSFDVDRWAA